MSRLSSPLRLPSIVHYVCTAMAGGASSGEALGLVFRIATVGLSLASAIMTAASTQCVYRDDGGAPTTVSYGDYASFRYSALADLLSAVLQGVAIYLEATRKKKAARTVELVDKLVQALTASSAALLLAVDDITSCGGPPRSRGQRGSLCGQAGAFCGRVRLSSAFSIAAAASVSVSVYTRHVPEAVELAPRPPPPPTNIKTRRKERGGEEKKEAEAKIQVAIKVEKPPEDEKKKDDGKTKGKGDGEEEEKKKVHEAKRDEHCFVARVTTPPAMPPPWCRCPRLTIPCDCEDPDLCSSFF